MSAPSKLLNLLSPVLVPLWNNSAMTEEAKRALSERLEALSDTGAPQHHPTPDDTESRGVAGMHSAPNATTPEPLTHLQNDPRLL